MYSKYEGRQGTWIHAQIICWFDSWLRPKLVPRCNGFFLPFPPLCGLHSCFTWVMLVKASGRLLTLFFSFHIICPVWYCCQKHGLLYNYPGVGKSHRENSRTELAPSPLPGNSVTSGDSLACWIWEVLGRVWHPGIALRQGQEKECRDSSQSNRTDSIPKRYKNIFPCHW